MSRPALTALADGLLIAVAAAVAEEGVQRWLLDHHDALYWGLASLHLVVLPLTVNIMLMPWSRAGQLALENGSSPRQTLFVWSQVISGCAGFIVPGVMAMALKLELWAMMTTIFGPYVLLVASVAGSIWWDQRTDHSLSRQGSEVGRRWLPLAVLIFWSYLVFLETMLLVSSRQGDPWGSPLVVGMAVFVGYLPTRITIGFMMGHGRWEAVGATLAFLHLLGRLPAG